MIYKYIGHELNVDLWESKESLKKSFYTDFYNFIKNNNGEADLKEHDIKCAEDFINFADFYAGVIGKYFCGKYEESRAKTIHDTIRTKLSIQWVPHDTISFIVASNDFDATFNHELFQLSIKTAEEYLDKCYDDRGGCELIKYMIQEARYNPWRHISSKELKERLLNKKIEIANN